MPFLEQTVGNKQQNEEIKMKYLFVLKLGDFLS